MPIGVANGQMFNIRRLCGVENIMRLFMRARAGGAVWIFPDARTWMPAMHIREKGAVVGDESNFQVRAANAEVDAWCALAVLSWLRTVLSAGEFT
eukprot:9492475-Pyramimonas_sp.AAC.1